MRYLDVKAFGAAGVCAVSLHWGLRVTRFSVLTVIKDDFLPCWQVR